MPRREQGLCWLHPQQQQRWRRSRGSVGWKQPQPLQLQGACLGQWRPHSGATSPWCYVQGAVATAVAVEARSAPADDAAAGWRGGRQPRRERERAEVRSRELELQLVLELPRGTLL